MPSLTASSKFIAPNSSPVKRPAEQADEAPMAKKSRTHAYQANPLGLKPLGNLLWAPEHGRTRAEGLGRLGVLPDELLLGSVFSLLEGEDFVRMAGTSKAFFAWSCVEGMWKGLYIQRTQGLLLRWWGSWRASYINSFIRPSTESSPAPTFEHPLPSSTISTPTLHSDVLFQPALCAAFDACSIFRSPSFVSSIPRMSGKGLSPASLPAEPVILTDLMSSWAAMSPSPSRRWTLDHLARRFPTQRFRAEATLATLPDYTLYHDNCPQDESPLYLFDSEFARKTEGLGGPSLGDDYEVPECFSEDLFSVMGDERPDYRWLIVGPARSGSTWHVDPNHTSAWNAVTVGEKAWVMFPPDVTPPGVYASEDGAHVEAPLSLAEWFISYYAAAKATYGPKAKDPSKRGKMREGICREGEILYVPSGWWHIVVNLTPAIAVTQNYVSHRELPAVLRFMRDRPSQVSGFKLRDTISSSNASELQEGGLDEDDCDETGGGKVFGRFVEAMRGAGRAEMVDKALEEIGGMERRVKDAEGKKKGGLWISLKQEEGEKAEEGKSEGGGFSFGFGLGDGELDDELDLQIASVTRRRMPGPPSSPSTTSPTPNDEHHSATQGDGAAESPFSAAAPSLTRPPLARLSSADAHLSRGAPLLFESLTRATLPSSSLTESNASWVDLCRADGTQYSPPRPRQSSGMERSKSTDEGSPASAKAKTSAAFLPGMRSRRSSIGSLQGVLGKEGGGAALARRRSSLAAVPPSPTGPTPRTKGESEVNQLNWSAKWWPFAVVSPSGESAGSEVASSKTQSPPEPPSKDSHDASRNILSLFAGRKTADDVRDRQEVVAGDSDSLEAELRDATSDQLDLPSIPSSRSAESFALEADEMPPDLPPKRLSIDKSLPPSPFEPPSSSKGAFFLPPLFAPTSSSSSNDTATASSLSSPTKKSDSPISLLSSLTISNPFNSSPASFFSSSAKSPTSPTSTRPHHGRHYSTSSHKKPRDEDDDGPTATPAEVEGMVDKEDRETIRKEEAEDAEIFSMLKDKYRSPKLPLVFCHGLFGFDYIGPAGLKPLRFSYWVGVEEALAANGVEVLIGRVPASASIEERAKVLCEMIGERFPGREVNLIGHSMGGLDGRYVISRLKPINFKIRSLTTISTPHRGSSFADYLLEDVLGAERVPTLLNTMKALGVPGGGKAFDDLTTTKMARFNEETPDDPSVRYFSFSAEFTPSWSNPFRIPWGVVYEREGPNDGLVSVESARWGDHRATLHNVNHADLIGWKGVVRYAFAAWSGHEIRYAPVSFFLGVSEMLADEGF
ncbi:lipase 2 [Rhodotorula toruloides]